MKHDRHIFRTLLHRSAILRQQHGFTLVELVVVLIILGVVGGATVPTLTGYLGSAHERDAIAHCRACVQATETVATQTAARGFDAVDMEQFYEGDDGAAREARILELADVPGEITEHVLMNDGSGLLWRLVYVVGDITVTYQNGEYSLGAMAAAEQPEPEPDSEPETPPEAPDPAITALLDCYAGYLNDDSGNNSLNSLSNTSYPISLAALYKYTPKKLSFTSFLGSDYYKSSYTGAKPEELIPAPENILVTMEFTGNGSTIKVVSISYQKNS